MGSEPSVITNQEPQADPSRTERGQRHSLSIRYKISAALLAASMAAALIFLLLVLEMREILRDKEMEAHHAQVAILAEAVGPALMFDDDDAARQLLGALRAHPKILGAVVQLPNGRELARYSAKSEWQPPALTVLHEARFEEYALMSWKSVEFQGSVVGSLLLSSDLAEHRTLERSMLILLGLVLLFAALATLLVNEYLRRQIVMPLQRIADTTDHIAREGDYRQRVRVCGGDELGAFAHSFNAMIEAIAQRDGELLEHKAHLEEMVVRRTADLEHAKERAETANRAKSAFLANMSHELRTPLNAMLGYGQILARDPELPARYRPAVATIQRGGDHLLLLINDVLDLAKVEAGRFELLPGPCALAPLLQGVAELFEMHAVQKGIGFRYEVQGVLPALVQADEKRLRQVLMNLLSNAVKFTEQGTVRLLARFEDGVLHVAVSDTGIGIPPERLDGLFLPFQQEGGAEYRNQGTGLGLAICKNLVELMGGSLGVESRPGEGSRFTFETSLPVLQGSGRITPSASPPLVRGYRRRDGKAAPFALLVVDDNADNRDLLRDILSPLGFETLAADGGEAGVAAARERHPDLVLMDLAMPDINGLEATARILATPGLERLPIVACSASAFEEDRRRSFEACCADHLAKPVQVGELLDCIGRHLALEWVMESPQESAGDPLAPPPNGPSGIAPELRKRLLDLVERGNIMAVRKLLAESAATGDGLLDELRAAADRMDMRRVQTLLQRSCEVADQSTNNH